MRDRAAAGELKPEKMFDVPVSADARTDFQDPARTARTDRSESEDEITRKCLRILGLADWLGGRDSNPDNVVQSHVSYR